MALEGDGRDLFEGAISALLWKAWAGSWTEFRTGHISIYATEICLVKIQSGVSYFA
jgi:hypothetical protein